MIYIENRYERRKYIVLLFQEMFLTLLKSSMYADLAWLKIIRNLSIRELFPDWEVWEGLDNDKQ